jgi:predicted dehydrogenase
LFFICVVFFFANVLVIRGNWRREDTTSPILLAKCCHDIDFLMWLLCSPASSMSSDPPHLPSHISSSGSLMHFRKSRKPAAAGPATNCLSCPLESTCTYSATNIYLDKLFTPDDLDWPLGPIVPEIEDIYATSGPAAAASRLRTALAEDYTASTPDDEVKARPWYGRCVWESDNTVCDDQSVTMTWTDSSDPSAGQHAKSALFHMVAPTQSVCERRGRIYGTRGELRYDEDLVEVHDFASGTTKRYEAEAAQGHGHGGGDDALAERFCRAVRAVLEGEAAEVAQRRWLGCTIEEVVRSHVAVFAAEEARVERKVVDWSEFWEREVDGRLGAGKFV